MSKKEKASQFILKVPAGIKMPAGITGYEVPAQPSGGQHSETPLRETVPPALMSAPGAASAPVSADAPALAHTPTPTPTRAPKPEVKVTESYLSAKLRQSERGGRPKSVPAPALDVDNRMADMWQEMEDQISFKAPKGAQLPADFLRNMGLDGETIMISPRAIEALKAMLGGKKNG